jgi:hypothetical protein
MPAPQFASNGFLEIVSPSGIGPIGVLRNTTDITVGRNSNAKTTPTTTGDVGFSTGVRLSEVSCTVACEIGSAQQANLEALFESQRPFDYRGHFGNRKQSGRGVIDSMSLSSKTNDVIEYSLKISAADGKAQ